MAKLYDISAKITNELPTIKITDEITVTVNNRKNTVLNVLAMVKETEKKKKEIPEEEQGPEDDFVMMQKALEMLVGGKRAQEIDEMDLPVNEYSEVFRAVMQVAQGQEPFKDETP